MLKPVTKLFVFQNFKPGDKRNAWLWNAHRTHHTNSVFLAPGNMILGAVRSVPQEDIEKIKSKMRGVGCSLTPVEVFIDNHKHLNCAVFALQLNAKN